jgi:hypothetical protein
MNSLLPMLLLHRAWDVITLKSLIFRGSIAKIATRSDIARHLNSRIFSDPKVEDGYA